MKHAEAAALDTLEPLLQQIRGLGVLRERKRGSFDSKFKVSIHFHEDPSGLYADLRSRGRTQRLRASDAKEQELLLAKLKGAIENALDRRTA